MSVIDLIKTKTNISHLQKKYSANSPITALTAYDALTARLVDECGVDIILVGDSLGMTLLGYSNTIRVTLDDIVHHTSAVTRVVKQSMVVADMPFLSANISEERTLCNAGRLLQEAGADAVKLEGGSEMASTIKRLTSAGIPTMGHIGLLPQQVLAEGGYKIKGRSKEEAAKLLVDAKTIEEAGAFAIVLEGIPYELSKIITESISIPTIGIGAGPSCSGQIQVFHDILGFFEDFVPKHTKRYANLAELARNGIQAYKEDVNNGVFPSMENSFK